MNDPAPVPRCPVDVDVAQPRERRAIGDHPAEARECTALVEEPESEGARDGSFDDVA